MLSVILCQILADFNDVKLGKQCLRIKQLFTCPKYFNAKKIDCLKCIIGHMQRIC